MIPITNFSFSTLEVFPFHFPLTLSLRYVKLPNYATSHSGAFLTASLHNSKLHSRACKLCSSKLILPHLNLVLYECNYYYNKIIITYLLSDFYFIHKDLIYFRLTKHPFKNMLESPKFIFIVSLKLWKFNFFHLYVQGVTVI